MQQNFFNTSFMSPPVQDTITDYSVIYEEVPLYFALTSGTGINEQLELFRNASNFSFFQIQYEKLLDNLKTWCDDHECCILFDDALINDEKRSPAFALFNKYLFSANNYFGNGEAIFFNEGKKNLEELWLLLENEHIPLDGKRKVLMELQTGLRVCADGIQTNIRNATNELKACTGINDALQQIKTEFIQQHALPTIQYLFGYTENYESFEIHYVNAYYNQVAKDFGLSEQEDSYISAVERYITHLNRLYFKKMLQEQFTPNRMLGLLLVKLRGDWSALHAELSEKLLTLRTNWSKIEDSELIQTMGKNALFVEEKILLTNALEQWNQKYGALINLNFYDLADVDDNGLIVVHDLPTLNKILEPQIIKKFSEQYLEPGNQFSLQIEPNLILCSHHGLLWCERNKTPEFITLKQVKKINPERLSAEEQVHYCFVLEQLFEPFLEEITELSGMLHALDKQLIDLIWDQGLIHCILNLDLAQQGNFLNYHANANQSGAQKLITLYPEKLLNHLCTLNTNHKISLGFMLNLNCNFDGIGETTLLGYAAHSQYWDFMDELALKFWFTPEHLVTPIHYQNHREVNLLWIIAAEKKWELLNDLLDLDLVTAMQLASCPLNEESGAKGFNVLYLLARAKQWNTLERLFKQEHLITEKLLASTILIGGFRGVNLLWILAHYQQWNLITILVQKDLIRFSRLETMPLEGACQGQNVLYQLGVNQQWDLLKQLFKQEHLITEELLTPTAFTGVTQGINLLWLLAHHKQSDLINILLQRQLIKPSMLEVMLFEGACQGQNVLYQLAIQRQWELLKQLFKQEHLITEKLLAPTAFTGVTRGTNLLWFLAHYQQVDLINILLQRQLIKPSMLEAMPLEGNFQGQNVLYRLGFYQQWELFKQLFKQEHLITEELLTPTAFTRGTNLLWLLVHHKQWDLINILLQRQLIKPSMLEAMPLEGNFQGQNVLYLLGHYKRWGVIKELLLQKIITTELLVPIILEGEQQGTTVLNLLINDQQRALIDIFVQQNLLTVEQQRLIPEERNLLSTNTQDTSVFFNVLDNKEQKRKAMEGQDECADESNPKKYKR